jgi:CheY-like chemotaxis protein/HPt (histidine-containing phosphotransfer) domain-containing protein
VLLNLLNNAVKFTEHGEITLRVRCEEVSAAGAVMRFEVADTGIGMTAEQCDRVFSAFVQADSSTTRSYGGSGLGLSISRRLVELMEGRIWVESTPGVGSRFCFTARFGLPEGFVQKPYAPLPDLTHLRILVVDDNAPAREIMAGIIEAMHLQCSAVADAEAGIAELERAQANGSPYDIVLMDWRMPGMDGIEAVRRIRANSNISSTLTIVMVTAYSREELLEQASDITWAALLEKPVSPSTVLEAITSACGVDSVAYPGRNRRSWRRHTSPSLEGARILLAEDNEYNRDLAVEILTEAGMTVDVVVNGIEAVERISRADYDAVLMDCQMPLMDGYQATMRMRQDPRFAGLPIIAMTANAMVGDREKCLSAGMNDHIAKPINVDELLAVLRRWIGPSRQLTAPEAAIPKLPGVDVKSAFRRIGNDPVKYHRLLTVFHEGQRDTADDIRSDLSAGDRESVLNRIHTLNALAGSMGAVVLSEKTEALLAALKQGNMAAAEAALTEMTGILRDLITAIGDALETSPQG